MKNHSIKKPIPNKGCFIKKDYKIIEPHQFYLMPTKKIVTSSKIKIIKKTFIKPKTLITS
jgi:hypothetical protein